MKFIKKLIAPRNFILLAFAAFGAEWELSARGMTEYAEIANQVMYGALIGFGVVTVLAIALGIRLAKKEAAAKAKGV